MPRETIMALPSEIQLSGIADLLQSPMVGTIGDIVGGVFGVPGVGSIAQGIISPLAKPKPKTVNPMAQMVQQYLAPRPAPRPPAPAPRRLPPPPPPPRQVPNRSTNIDRGESSSSSMPLIALGIVAALALAK